MAQAIFTFPRGFLWGTATAAHQVEGNNTANNWAAWEQEAGRIKLGQRAGLACDWWGGRWREDFDRAAESHQNAHRFSIEWSRIQPAPDRWDEDALDRYRQMLRGLLERGITPLVTLHHFSDPLWLTEQGGWENPAAVEHFSRFVRKTVEALKEYVSLWCTVNEPNVYASMGYLLGIFPPGKRDLRAALHVLSNLARGHAAAYHLIHQVQPQARVGVAIHYRSMWPSKPWLPLDRLAARSLSRQFNDAFPFALQHGVMPSLLGRQRIPEAKGTQDYIGLNYYTRDLVAFDLLKPAELFTRRFFRRGAALSSTGYFANEPEGMFEALRWATQFGLPILVTENGIEDADDRVRPRYLVEHVHQIWRAINFNWPVKGYFHWTLVDNFEWERGWTQRFGLWELDVDSQTRRKRPSADLYADICRQNALASETVARYAPDIFLHLFPNA